MNIRVTVIIPTYNYANYILEAIESVLSQNYPSNLIELIVIDDGSKDNTREVLDPYIQERVLQYYFQENKGKANATSAGIKKASGKYIFNLDADDWFLPKKIAESVAIFENDDEIVHVATPALHLKSKYDEGFAEDIPKELFGKAKNGNDVLELFYTQHLLFGGGSTYAARASILKQISIPDEVDMYIDEFLILTIFPLGKTYFIEKPLSVWRIHNSNYSGKNVSEQKKIEKGKRLLSSSKAILEYLIKDDNLYPEIIIKIYKFIHLNREMIHKQEIGKKTIGSIFRYCYNVRKLQLDFNILKRYYFFNILIPNLIYKLLKKVVK